MSIKIPPLHGLPASEGVGQRPAHANGRSGAGSAKRSVSISTTAQQLASLHATDADVDWVRVDALRAAIAAGTLQMDTRRIADGLIASARELLDDDKPHARSAE